MGTPFVQLSFEKFGTWTTKIYLKTVWKNLGGLEIELFWSELPLLPLQIEGDTYIVAEFYGLYDMDNRTIRRLNRVGLPMDIYAMSDLATENGLSIWQDMAAACTPGAEEKIQHEWM